ncbi:MAG: hypothetical protein ACRCZ9_02660, partial [Fusobacteriaceae bacterium]
VRLLLQNAYERLKSEIKSSLKNYLLNLSSKIVAENPLVIQKLLAQKNSIPILENLLEENSSWKLYLSFPESEKKIYRNLAKLLFEEKLGKNSYQKEFLDASMKSLICEILQFE